MKVAVVGATGLVGRKMMEVLAERNFPVKQFIPVASEKSVGKTVLFKQQEYRVMSHKEALALSPDIALFSAGGSTSLEWAPSYAEAGCRVIDNSSAWRMTEGIPLVVPEINADVLTAHDRIIANPNCSTIQLVMVLAPLHQTFGLKRVVVNTYQSVTGSGKQAVEQMEGERQGESPKKKYPHPIDRNVIPHCDVFLENAYTREEMKMVHESRKILQIPDLRLTATAVRVPVCGGHSEAVNIELNAPFSLEKIRELLENFPGVSVWDNPAENQYPMPLYAEGKDEVFAGRIRGDFSVENGLNLWIVSDNLRKGAATNAVQIAEALLKS